MTKVSRVFIDPRRMRDFEQRFWDILALCTSRQELKTFLHGFLTLTEIQMFSKRIQIAKMILEGYDYQTIETYVRIGSPTIARISTWLKEHKKAIEIVGRLVRIEEREKTEFEKSMVPFPERRRSDLGVSLATYAAGKAVETYARFKKRGEIVKSAKKRGEK